MNKVTKNAEVLALVRQHGANIRAFGVQRLGLFGSFARDEARPASDVDFFIEFDPAQKHLKNLVGLSTFLRELLGRKVEIVTPGSLNRFTGKYILQEVEYVALAA
jgi:predicted nucleotidyltransferase